MALYDLPYSTSVEELVQLQQQLRLQSLRQLELLRIRQAKYKSVKHLNQDADHVNGIVTNSEYGSVAGDEVGRPDFRFSNGVMPGVSRSSTVTSRAYFEHDAIPSNQNADRIDRRRNGIEFHETSSECVLSRTSQSDQSVRAARQKLASSKSLASYSSHTLNDDQARNGSVSKSIDDETVKLTSNRRAVETARFFDRTVDCDGKVVANKPPVYKTGVSKSSVDISGNGKKHNEFDVSYNEIDSSFLNPSRRDGSCTPERLNQSLEGTPKSILRHRQIIDKNVHVESKFDHTPTTKRSGKNRRGLNFSYSNVDDGQIVVGKSKSVNFLVDAKKDNGNTSRNSTARSVVSKQVLEQGFVEPLAADSNLYYTGKFLRSTNDSKGNTSSLGAKESFTTTTSDILLDSVAPANLLLHTGNDRKHARVVCELDKRAKSSMFSDELSATADESVQESACGSHIDQSREFSKLLSGRDQRGPLLGYDWIAGLMDNEKSLADIPDDCFDEVREFRRLNKDACVGRYDLLRSYEIGRPISPEVENPTHTCIHGYTVNERLFTEPVNSNDQGASVCPVCMTSRKEPSAESPGFVRVSIPQKTLEKPYRIKPHRRRSFDATDSCALSKHCLAGWECSHPSVIPTASNLDLRQSTNGLRSQMTTTEDQVQSLASDFSRTSRLLRGQVLDVRTAT